MDTKMPMAADCCDALFFVKGKRSLSVLTTIAAKTQDEEHRSSPYFCPPPPAKLS